MPVQEDVTAAAVRPGVSQAFDRPELIGGDRVGLLTNFTGVMPDFTRNVEALVAAGVKLTTLFGPEHGLRGVVQAGESEPDGADPASGLPVLETYRVRGEQLTEMFGRSGVDTVVFDMQDIGVRYYTYVWSMFDALCAAARAGVRFVVLDRPNPLTGAVVSGPRLAEEVSSFVGRVDVPLRHGLTVAELALLFNTVHLPSVVGTPAQLSVVPMSGWRRSMSFDHTGIPWVPPSPNMPTLDTAYAFCATGLIEGTNLSEGRGTTAPFQLIGAPYVDDRLAEVLRSRDLPGVLFRATSFLPAFSKHGGRVVNGIAVHLVDRSAFDPVRTGVEIIATAAELYPGDFAFLQLGTAGGVAAIDRLWGSSDLRTVVGGGGDPRTLVGRPSTVADSYPDDVLLYDDRPQIWLPPGRTGDGPAT